MDRIVKDILGGRFVHHSDLRKGQNIIVKDRQNIDYGKKGKILQVLDADYFHVSVGSRKWYFTRDDIKKI